MRFKNFTGAAAPLLVLAAAAPAALTVCAVMSGLVTMPCTSYQLALSGPYRPAQSWSSGISEASSAHKSNRSVLER